ncbi:thioesterase family protein [Fusibacter bizertensis]|jgi:Predicted thioesterase|uniref:Thioesterase family protein n=1 Tax=Fusibacter bizertensis TaxID=1488331 RepID=A0ABT6NEQ8_9FIRM|nr:thioesterase family protein [Fusibacter bizertensis]MDH8678850.1 thioesterase family protein [Fusibacter bizertensis]
MNLINKNFTEIQVKISDINYGNHMGNDKALLFFQDARIQFLRQLGYDEHRIGDNTGIIIGEAHVYFKKEVFLYDILSATISIEEISKRSFMMNYVFHRVSDQVCVFEGSTKIYAFDYLTRKACFLPEPFKNAIM